MSVRYALQPRSLSRFASRGPEAQKLRRWRAVAGEPGWTLLYFWLRCSLFLLYCFIVWFFNNNKHQQQQQSNNNQSFFELLSVDCCCCLVFVLVFLEVYSLREAPAEAGDDQAPLFACALLLLLLLLLFCC